MTQEWFTSAELMDLKLPGLPTSQRGINKFAESKGWQDRVTQAGEPLARKRTGRGGGWEYNHLIFPLVTQLRLARLQESTKAPTKSEYGRDDAWAFFESLTDKKKNKAKEKLDILQKIITLNKSMNNKNSAVCLIAGQTNTSQRTIWNWFKLVEGIAQADWLPYLAPRNAGTQRHVECPAEAWDIVKSDYLRAERPTFQSCYRRMMRIAEDKGWTLPSEKTLQRRMKEEVPDAVQTLCRYGKEALKQMYPAQERDRSVFHAMEAVNADGHKWDVWVEWPDGDVLRPMMTALQDIYSGMFVAWRVDKSENKEAFRLAFGDMVEDYGIPEQITLDNGRNFAAKMMTGGVANRFRFKIKEEEPVGILTYLGVDIHWTTPYSGQSKPIERGFRDFCDNIAKHPALAGCWAGNSPVNKPDYKPNSIPLKDFLLIVEEGIVEHNERPGRRTQTAAGRSFAETFRASYVNAPIRMATPEQRRMWLLAAEGVRVSKRDGTIRHMDNRYFATFLQEHRGQAVIARFDPQNLFSGLHVYRLDGSYLGFADPIEMAGFSDVNAAREHNLQRTRYFKSVKAAKEAHVKMTGQEIAGLLPMLAEAPAMEAKVVKMHPAQGHLMKSDPVKPGLGLTEKQKTIEADLIDFASRKEVKDKIDEKQERFERALEVYQALEADQPTDHAELEWFKRYQSHPEWKSRLMIWKDQNAEHV